jgi:large subunit ribosomal protein L1
MTKQTKKNKAALAQIDRTKFYTLEEAIKTLQDIGKARNFDQSLEIAINLNIDPRHADQTVRGMVTLPHGTGASVRVAVFARDAKADEAKAAGADVVGAEDLADMIKAGDMPFERIIASPDMMAVVGQLGKILGPKGMMPNPKLGTVTPNVAEAVKAAKGGAIEYRAEKAGIVHAGLGKLSFSQKNLLENTQHFINTIKGARPSGAKGTFIGKITITSSMGPGIKIDLDRLEDKSKAA